MMQENKIIVPEQEPGAQSTATTERGLSRKGESKLSEQVQRQAKLLKSKLEKVHKAIERMQRKKSVNKKPTQESQPPEYGSRKGSKPRKPKRAKTLESTKAKQLDEIEEQNEATSKSPVHELKIRLADGQLSGREKGSTEHIKDSAYTSKRSKETIMSQGPILSIAQSYQLRGLDWRQSLASNNFNPEDISKRKQELAKLLGKRRTKQLQLIERKSFSLIKRDSQLVQQEEAVQKRRVMYGISVSPAAKQSAAEQQAERIRVDKQLHPAKYAILSRKGLTDIQIFKSKTDYEEERALQRKSLGDRYLTLSKRKRMKTDGQQQQLDLPMLKSPSGSRYINYLPVISRHRGTAHQDEVERILSNKRSPLKEKLQKLQIRTEKLEQELSSKVEEYCRVGRSKKTSLRQDTQMQDALDARLFESLKAKLAMTQLI